MEPDKISTESSNKPKILLIYPAPISCIPPGITFVAKRFAANGFDVKVHINTFRRYLDARRLFTEVVSEYHPDIVGLSFGTYNVLEVYALQQSCAQNGYFVLAGGPHPSTQPEECLRNGADMVIRGEAEYGIDDLCRWWVNGRDPSARGGIRGASYLDAAGFAVDNEQPRRISNLDEVGETDFSFLDMEQFRAADGSIKGLDMIASGRGCPFGCTYCSHSAWRTWGKRTVDSLINEMVGRYERYGLKNFWMSDDTFTIDKDRVYEFCARLKKENLPINWMSSTRVTQVDEPLLRAMRDSGLKQITYGVESSNDDTLKRINKGYTGQYALDTVLKTGKLGIPMYINLMTGFPWETPDHVNNDIRFIKAVESYVYCFQLYGAVIPYPDTGIYTEFHQQYAFTGWWLKEQFQNAGMVIYQNVANPYTVSTYYQRNLYDDTYITEDYFFTYTEAYKKAVARMGRVIGWKSICAQTPSNLRRAAKYALGVASQTLYGISPHLEKKVVGAFKKKNILHEKRLSARFVE
jgi:radical SAM superfamily enzyme YgiQ (UPF0313 family)